MNIQDLTHYFLQYGAFFIYLIVLLEYLNLPGFPAGVIMPLAGIWAAQGEISFPLVMVLTVKKFPKHQPVIEEKMNYLREKGCIGVFVSKLLPMVRTLISIPAGMVKMDFVKYTVSSVCGIFLWNLTFVGAGYFFGDAAIKFFT